MFVGLRGWVGDHQVGVHDNGWAGLCRLPSNYMTESRASTLSARLLQACPPACSQLYKHESHLELARHGEAYFCEPLPGGEYFALYKIDMDKFRTPTSYQIFPSILRMQCVKMCAPGMGCRRSGISKNLSLTLGVGHKTYHSGV